MIPFYTPWKHQKTYGLLMFLGSYRKAKLASYGEMSPWKTFEMRWNLIMKAWLKLMYRWFLTKLAYWFHTFIVTLNMSLFPERDETLWTFKCVLIKFQILTLPVLILDEEKKSTYIFFHTYLWCPKRFYEDLKVLFKIFWGTSKKCENKTLS